MFIPSPFAREFDRAIAAMASAIASAATPRT
jgi:hypothetical protein